MENKPAIWVKWVVGTFGMVILGGAFALGGVWNTVQEMKRERDEINLHTMSVQVREMKEGMKELTTVVITLTKELEVERILRERRITESHVGH